MSGVSERLEIQLENLTSQLILGIGHGQNCL